MASLARRGCSGGGRKASSVPAHSHRLLESEKLGFGVHVELSKPLIAVLNLVISSPFHG